VFVTIYICTI